MVLSHFRQFSHPTELCLLSQRCIFKKFFLNQFFIKIYDYYCLTLLLLLYSINMVLLFFYNFRYELKINYSSNNKWKYPPKNIDAYGYFNANAQKNKCLYFNLKQDNKINKTSKLKIKINQIKKILDGDIFWDFSNISLGNRMIIKWK